MNERKGYSVVRKTLLYAEVLEELKAAIMNAQLRPGERLVESELADELGVSRGPIREALQELERHGIVVRIQNRGTFLREWTEKEIRDFYLFRAHVESLAVRLTAERSTEADHTTLQSILDTMRTNLERGDTRGFLDADTDYHLAISHMADCEPLRLVIEGMRWQTRLLMAWAKLTYGEPHLFQDAIDYHQRITARIVARDGTAAAEIMHDHILSSGERMLVHWHSSGQSARPSSTTIVLTPPVGQ